MTNKMATEFEGDISGMRVTANLKSGERMSIRTSSAKLLSCPTITYPRHMDLRKYKVPTPRIPAGVRRPITLRDVTPDLDPAIGEVGPIVVDIPKTSIQVPLPLHRSITEFTPISNPPLILPPRSMTTPSTLELESRILPEGTVISKPEKEDEVLYKRSEVTQTKDGRTWSNVVQTVWIKGLSPHKVSPPERKRPPLPPKEGDFDSRRGRERGRGRGRGGYNLQRSIPKKMIEEEEPKDRQIIEVDGGTRWTNNHAIFVQAGTHVKEADLRRSVNDAIEEAKAYMKDPGEVTVNLVSDFEGRTYGYGFIWANSSTLFNILVGLNPDGSQRYVGNSSNPENNDSSKTDEDESEDETSAGTSWGDECTKKEDRRKILDPLISLRTGYDDEDGEEELFTVFPAEIKEIGEDYIHNVVCCKKLPDGITEEALWKTFRPFVSDKSKRERGKLYPLVTITRKKLAFITFDPETRNAQFALLLTKRTIVSGIQLYFCQSKVYSKE